VTTHAAVEPSQAERAVRPLQAGDRLTRAEFERRYAAMTAIKKAELIEGVVYMPSPVSTEDHGAPHFAVISWLGAYQAHTPGVQGADNATVRLDLDNEPQPDALLRIPAAAGGRSRLQDGFVTGAPELVVEVAASSASYDLHDKLNAFRRNGVEEYVVWRTLDKEISWFVLREGRYDLLPLLDGLYRSEVFPGLWLDPAALIAGDLARVFAAVAQGVATPEHRAFADRLRAAERG
jgi:Uma2 family endonuclease